MRYLSVLLLASGCAAAPSNTHPAEPQPAEPQPAAPPVAQKPAEPAACDPLPSHTELAVVPLDAHRALHIVGKPLRVVDSAGESQIFDAHLLLTRGPCLLSRAPIGELSRAIDPSLWPRPLKLLPIGTTEGNDFAIEHGHLGDVEVVMLFVPLDVRFGLTEYHVVPFTLTGNTLLAGDRVQSGRDAMGGDLYYGQLKQEGQTVNVLRHGVDDMLPPIVYHLGGDGALHADLPAEEAPLPPVADTDRDGHDRRHAIQVCGAEGVANFFTAVCDGATPIINREGSSGPAPDGHILDRYLVGCGQDTTKVYVDFYHCP